MTGRYPSPLCPGPREERHASGAEDQQHKRSHRRIRRYGHAVYPQTKETKDQEYGRQDGQNNSRVHSSSTPAVYRIGRIARAEITPPSLFLASLRRRRNSVSQHTWACRGGERHHESNTTREKRPLTADWLRCVGRTVGMTALESTWLCWTVARPAIRHEVSTVGKAPAEGSAGAIPRLRPHAPAWGAQRAINPLTLTDMRSTTRRSDDHPFSPAVVRPAGEFFGE